MNANPFAVQAPDSVESILDNAAASCIEFNHGPGLFAGQYLASGRSDGYVAIWDIETKGLVRWLEGHVKTVTSVNWSKYNRYLASSSLDWNVIVWDLAKGAGERKRTLRFDTAVLSARFCPTDSRILLVVLESQQAFLVDLRKRRRRRRASNGAAPAEPSSPSPLQGDDAEVRTELGLDAYQTDAQAAPSSIISAIFSPDGSKVFAGTSKGDILVLDRDTGRLLHKMGASGASGVKELAFDRLGRTLVANSNDRAIRLFSVMVNRQSGDRDEISMTPLFRFQDQVNRTPWIGIGFSGDGEYVFGGAAHKISHDIYIWDRSVGALDKVLRGPRDALIAVDWHPNRAILASVSHTGTVNLWFTPPTEIWSAFAPGFEELEENVEYEEREDEFDLEDEDEVTRRKQDEEEADVDILARRMTRNTSKPALLLDSGDGELQEEPDDDVDDSFCLPVRLSLDLPNLDEDQ
ncbi:WD40 repeat-like protein [Acaromyces ingoldii]|uniref:WD40 repeat-like protein n=1 Tax=Acaromyces ingoldii TaxID=215250 RepID=A0A316YN44_9BASI|nr:WD40 repeat-like protein [Acaromyces ingoldii]PWN90234.1 WD40 repeat-like protein [Acaromyces ingoldii]